MYNTQQLPFLSQFNAVPTLPLLHEMMIQIFTLSSFKLIYLSQLACAHALRQHSYNQTVPVSNPHAQLL